ncbi:molybdopterin molybdotransferase [Paenibacillus sp. SORGH_AS306]|uniref:molybdopterin molybdotransferase MoeA n=1 Tax=unclassified Paenibacillus TaxID=185978 RepID=UPI0027822BE8|nr:MULTISPECIES: gephyrin-like molybdotransferase Glp [unclassified Paenibacillus]MDQ1234428.1 molybdopterin molybdotransferase [Paenibacillus sp. SORGH_AS_0306]MDR6111475.1 molybdopterin molybdotransferase [Paenibacillus sp. SORGH_AS_0338]
MKEPQSSLFDKQESSNPVDHNPAKFNRKPITPATAQQKIADYVRIIDTEKVSIYTAGGRFLAEDVQAPHPYPHFRRSGMDGYAVIASDIAQASSDHLIWLQVIDNIPCGQTPSVQLVQGTAARIMTGAMVPDEADTVVMLEMTETKQAEGQEWVGFKRSVEQGRNITPIGLEIEAGDILLTKGAQISAGEISVLATFGVHEVKVYRRPQVAIFSTGTELLSVEEPIEPGKIRNSNSYMLAEQVKAAGGEPHVLGAIMDDLELARTTMLHALSSYDIVISSGGVSVGDYDVMGDLVRSDEVEMLFNKISMRPGSVTTGAVKDGKLLFALSGNPGACFVGCELLVRPTIRQMMNSKQDYLPEWTATLGHDYHKINSFTRYVRGTIAVEEGKIVAYPASLDESSVMVTIKDSDCLIVIPPTSEVLPAGTTVSVLRLSR